MRERINNNFNEIGRNLEKLRERGIVKEKREKDHFWLIYAITLIGTSLFVFLFFYVMLRPGG